MKGESLTIEEYNLEIDLAEEDIKSGSFYRHDEVKEIMESWER